MRSTSMFENHRWLFALLVVGAACQDEAPRADVAVSRQGSVSNAPPAVSSPPMAMPANVPNPEPSFRDPLPSRTRDQDAPAKRYASLQAAACHAELAARKMPVSPAKGKTPGLESPWKLTGPVGGVRFEMPKTLYGFADCRLLLLLDDLSKELAKFAVVGVTVNNIYRPGSVRADKEALPAKPQKARKGKAVVPAESARPSQHARGLAIDITEFRLSDGRSLSIEQGWRGKLGAPPCGPASEILLTPAETDSPAESVALRNLTCAIARAGFCNHLITPNRDAAHFNHLHCDIEPGAREMMIE
jgi:hypothetical protein